jgi:predicted transcriptional regulator
MKKPEPGTQLTEVELELMLILWAAGEGTVHDVLAALPASRTMAYTSASTIIRILEKKGFVANRKEGKTHVYYPLLNRDEYEAATLGHVIGKLFNNTPAALVARLVDSQQLSKAEIAEIRALLDRRTER